MKVYVVVTTKFDPGIMEFDFTGVEVFKDAALAIKYYQDNQPAQILTKEIKE